jgi:hypothetical protein
VRRDDRWVVGTLTMRHAEPDGFCGRGIAVMPQGGIARPETGSTPEVVWCGGSCPLTRAH